MSAVGNIRVCHMMCDYSKYAQAAFDEMVTITDALRLLDLGSVLVTLDKNIPSFLQELNRALLLEGFRLEIHTG